MKSYWKIGDIANLTGLTVFVCMVAGHFHDIKQEGGFVYANNFP